MTSTHLHPRSIAAFLLLSLAACSSQPSSPISKEEIITHAESDGFLMGLAAFCGTSDRDLLALMNQRAKTLGDRATKSGLLLTREEYVQHMSDGIDEAQGVILTPSFSDPETKARNCEAINAKIQSAITDGT